MKLVSAEVLIDNTIHGQQAAFATWDGMGSDRIQIGIALHAVLEKFGRQLAELEELPADFVIRVRVQEVEL